MLHLSHLGQQEKKSRIGQRIEGRIEDVTHSCWAGTGAAPPNAAQQNRRQQGGAAFTKMESHSAQLRLGRGHGLGAGTAAGAGAGFAGAGVGDGAAPPPPPAHCSVNLLMRTSTRCGLYIGAEWPASIRVAKVSPWYSCQKPTVCGSAWRGGGWMGGWVGGRMGGRLGGCECTYGVRCGSEAQHSTTWHSTARHRPAHHAGNNTGRSTHAAHRVLVTPGCAWHSMTQHSTARHDTVRHNMNIKWCSLRRPRGPYTPGCAWPRAAASTPPRCGCRRWA